MEAFEMANACQVQWNLDAQKSLDHIPLQYKSGYTWNKLLSQNHKSLRNLEHMNYSFF